MAAPAPPVSQSIGRSSPLKAWPMAAAFARLRRNVLLWGTRVAWALALLLLIPISDTGSDGVQVAYDHAHQLFLHGDLIRSQQEAERGYRRFLNSNREWAAKFQLLEAQALIWRGMNEDALRVLATKPSIFQDKEAIIQSLTLAGVANTYMGRIDEASQKLDKARDLCRPAVFAACGAVPLRLGLLALRQGQLGEARQLFLESLSVARRHHDPGAEASALLNLGVIGLQAEHYDEAVDWSWSAYRSAQEMGGEDLAEIAMGNLGWAYYGLGDKEKALDLLRGAENAAIKLGSIRNQIKWLANIGMVYLDLGDPAHAAQAYQGSLDLARKIDSKEDIVTSLEDLAHVSISAGKLDEASTHVEKVIPMVRASGNRLDELDVMLAQGEIAAARRQDQQAETIFRTVETDPVSQTSMRLGAEHQLAKLYEAQGNTASAEGMYRTALTTFEAARAELKNEDSKLPFLANATPIYDDYIHFLVKQGRTEEALAAADQSRARTLAQGLGVVANRPAPVPAALQAEAVAQKRAATVLFYWLGEQESYLWAATAKQMKLFPLPAQRELTPLIERYRKALLEPALARDAANADGATLYHMLVAPAADLIAPGGNVIVICDGPLSLLNFETLIVPRPSPRGGPHYLIEDADMVSAPSLYMLAAAKAPVATNNKLLMLGDAVSPNPDYPELPMARGEIERIAKHFAPADETVYQRQAANSGAYLKSPLRDYAYIHFVAHGVASRTDPLDSAIILSSTGATEDSFKLHARDIIQRPIDARLVTISACYGGGTRSYAGEGLVGLSWAFLRAGAHNVIGALWEASDDSTPKLMDKLYAGLADGLTPSAALRQAKLELLHSEGKFRQPFYWAPFQIYAGL
jgi:CHAT domain-containing protein/Tfp pilus assembly protein PilF